MLFITIAIASTYMIVIVSILQFYGTLFQS